jgi:hypothetical protein
VPPPSLPPLTAVATREACRALKGQVLRQEVYAEDGTNLELLPYTVSERSYCVRQTQAPVGASHGVFLSFPREAIEYHHERIGGRRIPSSGWRGLWRLSKITFQFQMPYDAGRRRIAGRSEHSNS